MPPQLLVVEDDADLAALIEEMLVARDGSRRCAIPKPPVIARD